MGVASKINFGSIDNLFGTTDSTVNVKISELHTFKNHPFKVVDDEKMEDLVASIKERGVLNPITIRPCDNGYEIISGHRRTHACKLAGIDEIPAVIKELTDDEATIEMVDYNIQREELLPSEKAFAYKMKLDAIKRTAGRPSKNSAQVEHNKTSIENIAEDAGESRANVQRYIRLTNLIPDLLELVDIKKMPVNVGVELSYITKEKQELIYRVIERIGVIPSIAQAKQLRQNNDNEIKDNASYINAVYLEYMLTEKQKVKSYNIKLDGNYINKYFPNKDKNEIIQKINEILDEYFESEAN